MSLYDDHPGGIIRCDHDGCLRTRRHWCKPSEAEQWQMFMIATAVYDHCPEHRTDR